MPGLRGGTPNICQRKRFPGRDGRVREKGVQVKKNAGGESSPPASFLRETRNSEKFRDALIPDT